MSEPNTLARPDYVIRSGGKVTDLFCKVCGTEIAVSRSGRMRRMKNYCEIKIKFEDTTSHVTCVCRGCVPKIRQSETLMLSVYVADINAMITEDPSMEIFLEGKLKPKIIKVDTSQQGIK